MSEIGTMHTENEFAPAKSSSGAATEVAMTRAAQEVQAAMVIAKRFPRDENQAFARIMQACKRKVLAEQATYEFPRGGSKVEGPSIRLAEVAAQSWGNVECGVIELERRPGESTAMAFCWDLETNFRDTKIFTVRHVRDRSERKGGNQQLTDERDIYELVANMGARRKRACILAVIPGDVMEAAVDECAKTMKGDGKEPLMDRARKMAAFLADFGVTIPMIEKRLGHNLDAITEKELASLRKVCTSLKDGMSSPADHFAPIDEPKQDGEKKSTLDKVTDNIAGNDSGAAADPAFEKTAEPKKGGKRADAAAKDKPAAAGEYDSETLLHLGRDLGQACVDAALEYLKAHEPDSGTMPKTVHGLLNFCARKLTQDEFGWTNDLRDKELTSIASMLTAAVQSGDALR